jgi:Flp pilus assembly protein TadB
MDSQKDKITRKTIKLFLICLVIYNIAYLVAWLLLPLNKSFAFLVVFLAGTIWGNICNLWSDKNEKRTYALERALKTAGRNITCWACEHIGKSDFCNKCDSVFSNWSFNQKVFGKEG